MRLYTITSNPKTRNSVLSLSCWCDWWWSCGLSAMYEEHDQQLQKIFLGSQQHFTFSLKGSLWLIVFESYWGFLYLTWMTNLHFTERNIHLHCDCFHSFSDLLWAGLPVVCSVWYTAQAVLCELPPVWLEAYFTVQSCAEHCYACGGRISDLFRDAVSVRNFRTRTFPPHPNSSNVHNMCTIGWSTCVVSTKRPAPCLPPHLCACQHTTLSSWQCHESDLL